MRFIFYLSQYEHTVIKLHFKIQTSLHFSLTEIFTEKKYLIIIHAQSLHHIIYLLEFGCVADKKKSREK